MRNPYTRLTKRLSRIKTSGFRLTVTALSSLVLLLAWSIGMPLTAAAAPSCNSGNEFWSNGDNLVDHFFSSGGYFTAPSSGHQDFCFVWQTGSWYQMEEVGGSGNGDCLTANASTNEVVLSGCAQGQTDEQFEQYFGPGWTGNEVDGGLINRKMDTQNNAPTCVNQFQSGNPWYFSLCTGGEAQENITFHAG